MNKEVIKLSRRQVVLYMVGFVVLSLIIIGLGLCTVPSYFAGVVVTLLFVGIVTSSMRKRDKSQVNQNQRESKEEEEEEV